jgi:hypothetical protein
MKRKIHRLLFNMEKPKMYEKVSGKTMGIFPFLYMKGLENHFRSQFKVLLSQPLLCFTSTLLFMIMGSRKLKELNLKFNIFRLRFLIMKCESQNMLVKYSSVAE